MPAASSLDRVQDDHRHGEGDQAQKLGGGKADEQAALLAICGCRIAQRALKERTEHDADARGGGADADRGKTRTNDFGGFEDSSWQKLLG